MRSVAAAPVHRGAAINQNTDVEFLFLLVELHHQALDSPINVPIDSSRIVTRHIVSKVGKLQARAHAARAPFSTQRSRKALAHLQAHMLKAQEKSSNMLARRACHNYAGLRLFHARQKNHGLSVEAAPRVLRDFSWASVASISCCHAPFLVTFLHLRSDLLFEAESSPQQWTELGRLEGRLLPGREGAGGWSHDSPAGVSFPSSKSIFVLSTARLEIASRCRHACRRRCRRRIGGGYFHKDFTPLGLVVSRGEYPSIRGQAP